MKQRFFIKLLNDVWKKIELKQDSISKAEIFEILYKIDKKEKRRIKK